MHGKHFFFKFTFVCLCAAGGITSVVDKPKNSDTAAHWRTLGWCVPCLLTGTNDTDVPKCVEAQ